MDAAFKKRLYKAIVTIVSAIIAAVGLLLGVTSCNVTRVVTTKSEFMQRGDTSVVIQTKTTETYDGTVKYNPLKNSTL